MPLRRIGRVIRVVKSRALKRGWKVHQRSSSQLHRQQQQQQLQQLQQQQSQVDADQLRLQQALYEGQVDVQQCRHRKKQQQQQREDQESTTQLIQQAILRLIRRLRGQNQQQQQQPKRKWTEQSVFRTVAGWAPKAIVRSASDVLSEWHAQEDTHYEQRHRRRQYHERQHRSHSHRHQQSHDEFTAEGRFYVGLGVAGIMAVDGGGEIALAAPVDHDERAAGAGSAGLPSYLSGMGSDSDSDNNTSSNDVSDDDSGTAAAAALSSSAPSPSYVMMMHTPTGAAAADDDDSFNDKTGTKQQSSSSRHPASVPMGPMRSSSLLSDLSSFSLYGSSHMDSLDDKERRRLSTIETAFAASQFVSRSVMWHLDDASDESASADDMPVKRRLFQNLNDMFGLPTKDEEVAAASSDSDSAAYSAVSASTDVSSSKATADSEHQQPNQSKSAKSKQKTQKPRKASTSHSGAEAFRRFVVADGLVLQRGDIRPNQWQALSAFLESCPNIRRLQFRGMEISKSDVKKLGKGLSHIRHITFCDNKLGVNPSSLKHLVALLLCCGFLESTSILRNSIRDQHIPHVISLITRHNNLNSLSLSWNCVTDKGAAQLASALRVVRNQFAAIDLSFNRIGEAGRAHLEAVAAKRQQYLGRDAAPVRIRLNNQFACRCALASSGDTTQRRSFLLHDHNNSSSSSLIF